MIHFFFFFTFFALFNTYNLNLSKSIDISSMIISFFIDANQTILKFKSYIEIGKQHKYAINLMSNIVFLT